MSVSESGLLMYKSSRFLVPKALRAGLLKALKWDTQVLSMVLQTKESFLLLGVKDDINHVRARGQMCHQNAPSQPKGL